MIKFLFFGTRADFVVNFAVNKIFSALGLSGEERFCLWIIQNDWKPLILLSLQLQSQSQPLIFVSKHHIESFSTCPQEFANFVTIKFLAHLKPWLVQLHFLVARFLIKKLVTSSYAISWKLASQTTPFQKWHSKAFQLWKWKSHWTKTCFKLELSWIIHGKWAWSLTFCDNILVDWCWTTVAQIFLLLPHQCWGEDLNDGIWTCMQHHSVCCLCLDVNLIASKVSAEEDCGGWQKRQWKNWCPQNHGRVTLCQENVHQQKITHFFNQRWEGFVTFEFTLKNRWWWWWWKSLTLLSVWLTCFVNRLDTR